MKRTLKLSITLLACLVLPGMAAASEGEHMDRVVLAEKNMRELFGDTQSALESSDPDFAQMRDRLIYGEIAVNSSLDAKMQELVTLVVLTASRSWDEVKLHAEAALRAGATPVEIKEALYQCAPYAGFPPAEKAIGLVNEVFEERNITLPVESQSTVTEASRFADGLAVQKSIFGATIDQMHASTPENQKDIMTNYLSAFCFGDIYTRTGLDLKTRELLTFCIISSLGGCESQVKSHVQGNVNVGNSKEMLIDALAQSLPYIGFPRTLNALGCVNAVIPEKKS